MKASTILRSLLVLTCLLFFGTSARAQLGADFSSDYQKACAPFEVHFSDQSIGGATSYFWEFGDGTTSTLQNPVHEYDSAGLYSVFLFINNGLGESDSILKVNYIEVLTHLPVSVSETVINTSSCNSNDGYIELAVTGAGAPYNFAWSNGINSHVMNGLAPGNYRVTITSDSFPTCEWHETYQVHAGGVTFSSNITHPSSCSSSDGAIDIEITGGTPPYQYSWSTNESVQDITNLPGGFYSVTVTDDAACSETDSFTLVGTSTVSAIATVENVTCNGANDGVVTLSGTGGVAVYEYGTNPSFTTRDSIFENLHAGTHTFYIEDGTGCVGNLNVQVNEPSAIHIAETVNHATCSNTCFNGSVDVLVSGGIPPYAYHWTTGANSQNVDSLAAGAYSLTVTDANGCERVQNLTVGVDSINACNFTVVDSILNTSTCSASDGLIDLYVFGANSPYSYSWSTGDSTSSISGLAAGQYTVEVMDILGCSLTYTYSIGSASQSTQIFTVNNSCFGENDGVVEFLTSGASAPYHYTLSNGATTSSPNPRVDGLSAGNYSVTVSSDSGACVSFASFTITEPSKIQISGTVSNTSCATCSDGNIDLTVSGGTAPYSFSWNNGTFLQDLDNVEQGTYRVLVEDANGCLEDRNFTISDSATACINCVWPGDANYDGVANNQDVLAIGIAHGINGPVRANASLNWVGQQATDWNLALASGANLKHSDCDGNGIIDSNDVYAINLNYALTHAKTEVNGSKKLDPALYYKFPKDTVLAGQKVSVDVLFGRDSLLVPNLYGLAFSVIFDTSLVKPGTISFRANGSWLGDPGLDLLSFYHDLYSNGKLEVAETRLDQVHRSGKGKIGTVDFIMKDDISGKTDLLSALNLGFSNVKAISSDESEINVYHEGSTLYVRQTPTGVDNAAQYTEIDIFPNPAKNQIVLRSKQGDISQVNMYDLSGRKQLSILVNTNNSTQFSIDISSLSNGMYLLETTGNKGRTLNRIVKID